MPLQFLPYNGWCKRRAVLSRKKSFTIFVDEDNATVWLVVTVDGWWLMARILYNVFIYHHERRETIYFLVFSLVGKYHNDIINTLAFKVKAKNESDALYIKKNRYNNNNTWLLLSTGVYTTGFDKRIFLSYNRSIKYNYYNIASTVAHDAASLRRKFAVTAAD